MVKQVSALSLVLGVIAGYAVRGTEVTAQTTPAGLPLAADDKVTLIYQQVSSDRMAPQTDCIVMDLKVHTCSAHRGRRKPDARSTSRLSSRW